MKKLDKHGMPPRKVIRLSPFHASVFITILRSIKTDYIYHHLYDFGTVGLFVAIGKEAPRVVAATDGEITRKTIMRLGRVMDERFCDGLYWVNSLRLLNKLLSAPEQLTNDIPERVKDDK